MIWNTRAGDVDLIVEEEQLAIRNPQKTGPVSLRLLVPLLLRELLNFFFRVDTSHICFALLAILTRSNLWYWSINAIHWATSVRNLQMSHSFCSRYINPKNEISKVPTVFNAKCALTTYQKQSCVLYAITNTLQYSDRLNVHYCTGI